MARLGHWSDFAAGPQNISTPTIESPIPHQYPSSDLPLGYAPQRPGPIGGCPNLDPHFTYREWRGVGTRSHHSLDHQKEENRNPSTVFVDTRSHSKVHQFCTRACHMPQAASTCSPCPSLATTREVRRYAPSTSRCLWTSGNVEVQRGVPRSRGYFPIQSRREFGALKVAAVFVCAIRGGGAL